MNHATNGGTDRPSTISAFRGQLIVLILVGPAMGLAFLCGGYFLAYLGLIPSHEPLDLLLTGGLCGVVAAVAALTCCGARDSR